MQSDRDAVEALTQVDLFAGLTSELLEALAQTASVSEFEMGDQLVRRGTKRMARG